MRRQVFRPAFTALVVLLLCSSLLSSAGSDRVFAREPRNLDTVWPAFSTYVGGSNEERALDVAIDEEGNTFVVGETFSDDIETRNAVRKDYGGDLDGFVMKFSPRGRLIYSSYLGGSGFDRAVDVDVDSDGNAYVLASSGSGDFPEPSEESNGGLYVMKLGPEGDEIFTRVIGGGATPTAIDVDQEGRAYITGVAFSDSYPSTPGAYQEAPAQPATDEIVVSRLSKDGSDLEYSTYIGGNSSDTAHGIAVGPDGSAIVAGATTSSDYPLTPNAFGTRFDENNPDGIVTKLSPDGSTLEYSTLLGHHSGDEVAWAIAADSTGAAYVVGQTTSRRFPTVRAYQPRFYGTFAAFVSKLSPSGSELVYSTFFGNGYEKAFAVDVDNSGAVYFGGTSASVTDIKLAFQAVHAPDYYDAFLAKLKPSGRRLAFATFMGGERIVGGSVDEERIWGIDVGSRGSVAVAGETGGEGFPIVRAHKPKLNNLLDGFAARLRRVDRARSHSSRVSLHLWRRGVNGRLRTKGFRPCTPRRRIRLEALASNGRWISFGHLPTTKRGRFRFRLYEDTKYRVRADSSITRHRGSFHVCEMDLSRPVRYQPPSA